MLLLLLASCSKPKDSAVQASGDQPVAVRLAPVRLAQANRPIILTGSIASDSEAKLAFKIGGIVAEVLTDEGARVQKGQLLARLDLTEINAQVTAARIAADKAARDLKRAQALYADSVITLEQLEDLTSAHDAARQSLEIASFNAKHAEIRAPQSGTILKKLMNPGEVAGPGTPVLMMIGGAGNWVLRASLTDREWAQIKIGTTASVELDAWPGERFTARVKEVAAGADPFTGLYQVELQLAGVNRPLAQGLFARAELSGTDQGSFQYVPIEAVIEGDGSQAFVFVPDGDNAVTKRQVSVAFIAGREVAVSRGLEGVKQVVTAGSPFLTETSSITIMP